jgi:hypothetical protein
MPFDWQIWVSDSPDARRSHIASATAVLNFVGLPVTDDLLYVALFGDLCEFSNEPVVEHAQIRFREGMIFMVVFLLRDLKCESRPLSRTALCSIATSASVLRLLTGISHSCQPVDAITPRLHQGPTLRKIHGKVVMSAHTLLVMEAPFDVFVVVTRLMRPCRKHGAE